MENRGTCSKLMLTSVVDDGGANDAVAVAGGGPGDIGGRDDDVCKLT